MEFNILVYRLSYTTLLVLLLLPFISVKCATGQKIVQLNGYQLAKGGSYRNKLKDMYDYTTRFESKKESKSFDELKKELKAKKELQQLSTLKPNIAIIVFLLVLIPTVIISFTSKAKTIRTVYFLLSSFIMLLSLIGFFAFLSWFRENQIDVPDFRILLEINFEYGYYFSFAVLLSLLIYQLRLIQEASDTTRIDIESFDQ